MSFINKNKTTSCILASFVFVLFVSGCALSSRGFPPRDGINNLDRVDNRLFRGAQPNALGIETLNQLGIRTIINLRLSTDTWLAEEQEAAKNGINYINVPMNPLGRPTDEQVDTVLAIIESSQVPVFVHCEYGCDRTGTIVACYRIKRYGWTGKQALKEAKLFGMSHWEIGMKNFVVDFEKRSAKVTAP